MKKHLLVILMGLCFVTGMNAQTVESQNVVGFFKLSVDLGWNLLSVPMQKLTVATGQLDGPHSTPYLTDNESAWADGEYAWDVVTTNFGGAFQEQGKSKFYIEITGPTNSSYIGRMAYIETSDASNNRLEIRDGLGDLSGLNNETYKIVPALRVRDIFGEPGASVLTGDGTLGGSDQVHFFTGGSYELPIYHHNAGFYVQGASFVEDKVVDRDSGMFVNRQAGPATNVVITGEVSPNPQSVVLPAGWHLVGGLSVVDETLNQSSLTNTVQSGASLGEADQIYMFTSGAYELPIYLNSGFWVQGASLVGDSKFLEASQGYFINVLSNDTEWVRESPL